VCHQLYLGFQLFHSPLQCVPILTQQSYRLYVSALIASHFQIVDVLPELLWQGLDLVNAGIN
jgi:hypothetical protein